MRTIVLIAIVVAACGSPEPTTTYISSGSAFERALMNHTNVYAPSVRYNARNSTAPARHAYWSHHKLVWFDRDRAPGAPPITTLDMSLTGYWDVGGMLDPCRLQFGPSPVRKPFSVDFLFDLFEDRDVGERARRAVGAVPIGSRYDICVQVDGFNIHLSQFPAWDGTPNVVLVVDGCAYVPGKEDSYRYDLGPLVFPDP